MEFAHQYTSSSLDGGLALKFTIKTRRVNTERVDLHFKYRKIPTITLGEKIIRILDNPDNLFIFLSLPGARRGLSYL